MQEHQKSVLKRYLFQRCTVFWGNIKQHHSFSSDKAQSGWKLSLDVIDLAAIRRKVHQIFFYDEIPTVNKIMESVVRFKESRPQQGLKNWDRIIWRRVANVSWPINQKYGEWNSLVKWQNLERKEIKFSTLMNHGTMMEGNLFIDVVFNSFLSVLMLFLTSVRKADILNWIRSFNLEYPLIDRHWNFCYFKI